MRKELLDELMIISEEEKKYKSGQSTVEQSLYAKDNLAEIDRKRLLQRGKLITVRPHSRFVDFPEHRHNYDVCGTGQYYTLYRGKRTGAA